MTKSNLHSESKVQESSTRWWESYLVRYFVGFIIGSICVAIITHKTEIFNSQLSTYFKPQSSIKPDWTALVIALSFLGIMYCYIASSPITVLHAARYKQGYIDSHARHFWLGWLVACFLFLINPACFDKFTIELLSIISIVLIFLILLLPVKKNYLGLCNGCNCENLNKIRQWFHSSPILLLTLQVGLWSVLILCLFTIIINYIQIYIGSGEKLSLLAAKFWMLSLPVFWIGISQYFVLFRLLNENKEFIAFYKKLFNARRKSDAKDIRDTYTHLREHSNSVFIVVVELAILAVMLAFIETTKQFKQSYQSESSATLLLFGLFFWMIPTVFMWGRANVIERDFAENPEQF